MKSERHNLPSLKHVAFFLGPWFCVSGDDSTFNNQQCPLFQICFPHVAEAFSKKIFPTFSCLNHGWDHHTSATVLGAAPMTVLGAVPMTLLGAALHVMVGCAPNSRLG